MFYDYRRSRFLITHILYQAMCITGIWMMTSTYLMSSKSTLLTVHLILHITRIFTEALSFHSWLCICEMPDLKVVLGHSLTLQYWIIFCRSAKPASCKHFNRTAQRMHWFYFQLVFVIDISLGYIQCVADLFYCVQFTAWTLWFTELH
jgi:hypothetical protein